jgi:hypothetical protein
LASAISAAALAAAFARRFCFFRFTGGAAPSELDVGAGCGVDARVGEGCEEPTGVLPFGTVMNLDPSLFVYFAVAFEFGEEGAGFDTAAG